ncbi:MAG: NFACT family protein [Nitrososphaerota archaeon]|nr:NFACT family protein [Nitrososphaerota archaeon]
MEISAIEINILCKRVSEAISGYFLSSVYSMEDGILLRLNHATKPEKLVAVSSFAVWITTKNLSIPQATKFVSSIRDTIERCEIKSVDQLGNERIAKFEFVSRKGEKWNLYAEFFSHGNLVLTDPSKDEEIIEVARPQSFRHRRLVVGEKYVLPPSRGMPLQELSFEKLDQVCTRTKEEIEHEQLSSVKWFGRNVGTTRKLVEEIFYRAKIDPNAPAGLLTATQLTALISAAENLKIELVQKETGFVLVPSEESELDVDVCCIVPHVWSEFVQSGLASIQSYTSLHEALDQVQIESVIWSKKKRASSLTRAKVAELESAIGKQQALIEKNEVSAREFRALAQELMRRPPTEVDQHALDVLQSYGIIEVDETSGGKLRFAEEPKSYLAEFNSLSLASRLFDEAKRLEASSKRLQEIKLDLESQRGALIEQTRLQEERAEKKIVVERREKQWYERYRWFFTSEGELAIGGRDSTSNSIVINKYMTKGDIVCHADLHGSPFFVLKRKMIGTALEDSIALELAQATVSFSRAWKDELGSADAYWIYPEQVKKSAPTGEYLARGSFFIEGKKNFVRHVKVELSVGICLERELPRIEGEGSKQNIREDGDQFVVVCGPEKSISAYCGATVKIAPGKMRTSEFTKRLKQQLVSKLKSAEAKEIAKRVNIDDIIRVLPAGGYKFVSER